MVLVPGRGLLDALGLERVRFMGFSGEATWVYISPLDTPSG
jgi:hypothetical protein